MTKTNCTTNSVAQIVTDQIIAGLKEGHVPWRKPWLAEGPRNFVTGHRYSGINTLLTAIYCMQHHWDHPLFASFTQIEHEGGHVRKGEHGNIVVFAKPIQVTGKQESEDSAPEERTIRVLRYYKVFNLAQTDLDPAKYVKQFAFTEHIDSEVMLYAHHPLIQHGGQRACYIPSSDVINLPSKATFRETAEYYMTAFHELTHWTGHVSRLDRLTTTHFGSGEYSLEELVAEIGANMLGRHCGIAPSVLPNSQAYINGWLSHLQNDPNFVIRAASKAQKAYDYLAADVPNTTPPATVDALQAQPMLLLAERCEFTCEQERNHYGKEHSPITDSHYWGERWTRNHRFAWQTIEHGTTKSHLLATDPLLYERIAELDRAYSGKGREYQPRFPTMQFVREHRTHHGPSNRVEVELEYQPCIPGKEWLEKHAHDQYEESSIEITVQGGGTISMNGDYATAKLKGFMGQYCKPGEGKIRLIKIH